MLVSVSEYVAEAVRRWRERNAAAGTGVACPDCGRELQQVVPPVSHVTEMVWRKAVCPACGNVSWFPHVES